MASDKSEARRQRWLLVGAASLLVLVVVGSVLFFFIVESRREKPPQVRRSTVTAVPATPSPTLQVSPTPQVLCYDYFADNKKGWAIGDAAGYVRDVTNGRLTLSATNHKPLIESMPTGCTTRDFADFSLTLTYTLLEADSHDSLGLYVRGDSNLDHDYRLDIFTDNTYSITKEWLDSNNHQIRSTLVPPTYTEALLSMGRENTLTLMMKGPTLILKINGQVVKTLTDPDYTHGQISLFLDQGNTSDAMTVSFGSIVIASAPDTLP